MKISFDQSELHDRITLNRKRLENAPYYQITEVFSPSNYDWYGDKEGRALLAFVSHYKINGVMIPCMELLLQKTSEYTGEKLYFGPKSCDIVHEQQLSGHSWFLRGLCEHYEQFEDEFSLRAICSVVKNLYLPTRNKYSTYPIKRNFSNNGDVSGNSTNTIDGWCLSTDIGCAFMSIDGLSHAYKITRDPELKALLDEMIDVYAEINKVSLKAQTHCTLTAARGMMRMYNITNDSEYLRKAADIFELYVNGGGMTHTYQNLNWWGRPDSWTEPCAIVDSLMLAIMLFKATGQEHYRTVAARIYVNGFASLERNNGGAGTDSLICDGNDEQFLYAKLYEAYFCCTMRLSEGLWYISENSELLYYEEDDDIFKNEFGIYVSGDRIYAEISGGGEIYAEKNVLKDGHKLSPLLKYYRIPADILMSTKQQVVF